MKKEKVATPLIITVCLTYAAGASLISENNIVIGGFQIAMLLSVIWLVKKIDNS